MLALQSAYHCWVNKCYLNGCRVNCPLSTRLPVEHPAAVYNKHFFNHFFYIFLGEISVLQSNLLICLFKTHSHQQNLQHVLVDLKIKTLAKYDMQPYGQSCGSTMPVQI